MKLSQRRFETGKNYAAIMHYEKFRELAAKKYNPIFS